MTKSKAISYFGSAIRLAEALDINPSSITRWDDDAIPKLREYEIKDILSKRKKERDRKRKAKNG